MRQIGNWIELEAALAATLSLTRLVLSQAKKAPVVIGWLDAGSPETSEPFLVAFKEAIATHGLREGTDITYEFRWARGRADRFGQLAIELAAQRPTVILVSPRNATVAVAKAASEYPSFRQAVVHSLKLGLRPVLRG